MDDSESLPVLHVQGDRVVVGDWSTDLEALVETSAEVRGLMREKRFAEAQALVRARCVEEQAALVAVDEDPEELLSLTAMDDRGRPGYLPAVVDRLPSETIAGLVAPKNLKHSRFNLELLRVMSPATLGRTVDETLDPVYYHGDRSRVSWEWLSAITALEDVNRIAELLYRVDESALEDAFLERIDNFDMNAVVGSRGVAVSAFKLLSESSASVELPPVHDPETRGIAQAIHQAAPDLLKRVLRAAWERAGGL